MEQNTNIIINKKETIFMATELEIKRFIKGKIVKSYKYDYETNNHILEFEDGTIQVLYSSMKS